jgi:hypothetical protein
MLRQGRAWRRSFAGATLLIASVLWLGAAVEPLAAGWVGAAVGALAVLVAIWRG